MHLIPPEWIFGLAQVMQQGATKYAERNWELGMDWSIPYSCAMRHLLKWFAGERVDPESGLHHLLHAAWNCLAAYYYEEMGRYGAWDDRPRPGVAVVPGTNPLGHLVTNDECVPKLAHPGDYQAPVND
jgi:hypothetical protein